MQYSAYLKRINFQESLKLDKVTLFQLHQANLYNIPFENLNIQYGIPINLTANELYQKVVEKNRGGFCYELNGLFNWLLQEIGFQTTLISAKVINKEGKVGPAFDHAALIIDLEDKRWLVDVGYGGDSFVYPKELVLDVVQKDIHAFYKFTKYNEEEWLLLHSEDGTDFKGQYVLSFANQRLTNFEPECHRKQTQADSHFMVNYICTMATPSGRISIFNDKFITKSSGEKVTALIENEKERFRLLKESFKVPTDEFSPLLRKD